MSHTLETTPDLGWKPPQATIRVGRPDDATACGTICYEAFCNIAGAHSFPPDFPHPEAAIGLAASMLARDDVFGVVAEIDGRVVGSNFLWEGDAISGVGPITIDPACQNGALGRQLMEAVLRRAREHNHPGVRLVQAAYHNRSLALYARLGFEVREPLSTLQGPAIGEEIPGHPVRAATPADLDACNRLCHAVHGCTRGAELSRAIADGTARVVEHQGRISGYATLIGFFGHAVGEGNEDLKALIAAAADFPGPGFLLPSRNTALLRWCLARELRIVQPMTLMSLGLYNEPVGAFLPSILY